MGALRDIRRDGHKVQRIITGPNSPHARDEERRLLDLPPKPVRFASGDTYLVMDCGQLVRNRVKLTKAEKKAEKRQLRLQRELEREMHSEPTGHTEPTEEQNFVHRHEEV